MEETLISFETAKLAKEKGFIEPVINYYHMHEGLTEPELIDEIDILLKNYKRPYEVRKNCNTISTEFGYVENFSAPTQSLLQKWLREVHNIHIGVNVRFHEVKTKGIVMYAYELSTSDNLYDGIGDNLNKWMQGLGDEYDPLFHVYKTYEEALEAGLQEALKLIK